MTFGDDYDSVHLEHAPEARALMAFLDAVVDQQAYTLCPSHSVFPGFTASIYLNGDHDVAGLIAALRTEFPGAGRIASLEELDVEFADYNPGHEKQQP